MFEKNMDKIKDNLLSRIVFLNNGVLTKLYEDAREENKKPTLLRGIFDFDKFVEEYPDEEAKNLDNNKQNLDHNSHLKKINKENDGIKIKMRYIRNNVIKLYILYKIGCLNFNL